MDASARMISIKQVHQKSVIFATVVFLGKGFQFQPYVCNRCHNFRLINRFINDLHEP